MDELTNVPVVGLSGYFGQRLVPCRFSFIINTDQKVIFHYSSDYFTLVRPNVFMRAIKNRGRIKKNDEG